LSIDVVGSPTGDRGRGDRGAAREQARGSRQDGLVHPGEPAHDLVEIAALPRPDIRLVVTDMDGTLLDDDRQVSDDLWPLVHDLREAGVVFSPASGRHHVSLRRHFTPVADETTYIASNGAHVLAGSTELHSDCLDPDVTREVLARLRHHSTAPSLLVGKATAYVRRGDEHAFAFGEYLPRVRVVDETVDAVSALVDAGDAVLSVGVFDTTSTRAAVRALAPLAEQVNVMSTHHTWVDVVSPTADKGHAVAALQHDLGIGADETVVFGDFLNDLGMLDRATFAFAMANAHPEVAARSWRTAPANSSNGVVRTLRALLDLDQ
jgi:Cof subfamily protein (haloacid dehalogenase superfamily)